MAELEEGDPVNPKPVKGVNTAGDGDGGKVTLPAFRPELAYKEPKTEKEAWLTNLSSSATARSASAVTGTDFLVSQGARSLYTPIDLAKGIPDKWEREKFISENGSRMVQLLDPNKFGVKFERDLDDYAAFKQKNYNTQIKKFLDDLDENQGILAELGNTVAKLTGLAWGVAGVVPLAYGLGSALFNWDASKIFNNAGYDLWQEIDDKINSKFAVYGGSDYSSGNKNFFARFITHPMKSLNADIMPAVNFVGSAVATELLATAAAPFTGGASLMANTARLGAQATNMFSKSYRVLRGLDQLADFNNMRQIASLTQKYRAGLGTVTSMVRSAGLESSLIARSTYDQTLEKSKINYLSSQGFSQEEIYEILGNKEVEEATITPEILAKMKKDAEDASELSWFTNVPLVGFSNMIQFSKVFSSGYRVNQALSRLNPLRMTGVVAKGGKVAAKADVMGRGARLAGYTGATLKSGVTEGFEEYAQGVMEQGYSDYWSAGYTEDAVKTSTSFLGAMTKAARNYGGSVEGFDSMSIGFLMGMLGIKLPVKIDPATGKLTRGWETYGGARQEIKELKKQVEEDRTTAKIINDNPINPVLKNNFDNMAKNITIQAEMDKALEKGDIFNYKNKEYEQLHSFVSTRIKNGIGDTIDQEITALEQLPLATFNEQFATPGVLEFTEETKKVALDKMRSNVNNIIEAHEQVDTAFKDTKLFVDFWRRNFKGVQDPAGLTEALKDQMTFLYGATKNLENREEELESQIAKATKGNVSPKVLNKLIAQIGEITKEGTAEFATTAREIYKAEMNNWKENDPASYNLNRKQIEPLLQDLILIKERKAKISKMYDVLFTNKGAKEFLNIYSELVTNAHAAMQEQILKQAEEEAKKAKSSDTLNKVAADEKSVSGEARSVDNKTADEISATDQEMANIIAGLSPETDAELNAGNLADLVSRMDSDTVLQTLQSKPALFREILQKLEKDGKPIPGLTNIDQLPEILAENPTASARISAALAEILKAYNENKEVATSTQPLDYADPTDASQPAPSETEATSLEEFFNTKSQELQESSIYQTGTNVSDNSIIPVIHDKKIVDNKLVRNPETGKYEVWTDAKGAKTDQPVDLKKLNSPDFLNNKELHNNNVEATFKVEETKPYPDPKTGKLVEITEENIRINVYHEDTFIGRLPAYQPGMPAHFLALRKAIVAQESGVAIEEEVTPADESLKVKIADIERRRKEVDNWQLPKKVDPKKQVIVQPRLVAEGNEQKIIDTLNDILDAAFTDPAYRNSINRLNGAQAVKDTSKMYDDERAIFLKTIKDRYYDLLNQELAALEGTQADINLTADKVLEVLTETSKKFGIVELNKDNSENIDQEYIIQQIKDTLNTLGLPYKDVVAIRKSTYNVINSKGESIEILKLLQMGGAPLPAKITAAKYLNSLTKEEKINYAKKELASLEQQPTSRTETIDKNFDQIIEQLAKAKVNIFFNEETNSNKKC